jgi:hypothetical protein
VASVNSSTTSNTKCNVLGYLTTLHHLFTLLITSEHHVRHNIILPAIPQSLKGTPTIIFLNQFSFGALL